MRKLDPRQQKSRAKIHEAFLTLLLKENMEISVQSICQVAQLTRPTFYNLYKNIYDLRVAIHEDILDDLKESLTILNPVPIQQIKSNISTENMVNLFNHIKENSLGYEVLLVYKPDALFIEKMKSILTLFIEDGLRVSNIEEKMLRAPISFGIYYTTGAYLEGIIWWIKQNYSYTSLQMAQMLLETSTYGPFNSVNNIGDFKEQK